MYRHCIFCSGDLRANEALPEFPVGRRVAFDAVRGRLWAVCPRCSRWNLAPLEERWEALERAERLFRDARLRVQSENVGLARMADGAELVRVGDAVPGELAAWRYGRELLSRRLQHLLVGSGFAVASVVALGLQFAGIVPALSVLGVHAYTIRHVRRGRQVLHRIPGNEAPGGRPMVLKYNHLGGARLTVDAGEMALELPFAPPVYGVAERTLLLRGDAARAVLGKALVRSNQAGAKKMQLDSSLALLAAAGTPDEYLRHKAREAGGIGFRFIDTVGDPDVRRAKRRPDPPTPMTAPALLALEIALHEDTERVALEGELSALRAAWREAEEIARIADALPDEPPEDGTERG